MCASLPGHEAAHAGIAPEEAVLVDQVQPARHRAAACITGDPVATGSVATGAAVAGRFGDRNSEEHRTLPGRGYEVARARPCDNPGSLHEEEVGPANCSGSCDGRAGTSLRLTHGVHHPDGIDQAPLRSWVHDQAIGRYKTAGG